MLQDIRQVREKVENAKRLKALEQKRINEKHKDDVYSGVRKAINETRKRNAELKKNTEKIGRSFIFMKISAAACLLVFAAFLVHSAFKDNTPNRNVTILIQEEPADELETAVAVKYVREILEDVALSGTKALDNHWSSHADEESRFYAGEVLQGGTTSPIESKSVNRLSDNSFKVYCEHGGHPVSFYVGRESGKMSLIAVN